MLVGRDTELAALHRVLDAGRPALALVTGHAGSGKSALVLQLQAGAAVRGWATPAALLVNRDTTPQSFALAVRMGLAGDADGFAIESGPRLDARGLSRGMAAHSAPPTSEAEAERCAVELVERLEDAAPVLAVIDGFRPNEAFERWFDERLVPLLLAARRPVAAVVTSEHEPQRRLLEQAAERVVLGPLDAAATERFLRQLSLQIDPPLEESEIAAYVTAAAERPELLPNLHRVMALALRAPSKEGPG